MKNQSLTLIILVLIVIGLAIWIYFEYLTVPKIISKAERLQTTFDQEVLEKIKILPPHGRYPIEPNLDKAGRSDPFAPF